MTIKRHKGKLPPFVPVIRTTMASPAWKALSYGARCLYIVLRSYLRVDNLNNGRVFRSHRDVCSDLGTRARTSVEHWFYELEHYGFIVKTAEHALGVDGCGVAPHWRLTECPSFDAKGEHIAPTRDFERWDGVLFRWRPKTESRHGNNATPALKQCHTDEAKGEQNHPEVAWKQCHRFDSGVAWKQGHNCLPLPLPYRPTPITDAVGPRLRYPVAKATQPYTGYSSLPIELRMLPLGLRVA